MIRFWVRALWILLSKPFRKSLGLQEVFEQTFRVGLLDCEGFRVMSAFRYANYLDYNRWEFIVRGALFKEVFLKGCSTGLISQKIIYYKPLQLWEKFTLRIHTVGWDDKCVYNVQYFERNDIIYAMCISRSLIWKKGYPQIMSELLANVGVVELHRPPPEWVAKAFEDDRSLQTHRLL
jgi:acyl-CoA thioesterase FadM